MENSKFLKWTIVILLLINISTLAFMWFNKPGHGPHMPPPGGPNAGEFLVHELKFDDKQQKMFSELHDKHHEAVAVIIEQNGRLHHRFFELLKKVPVDSLAEMQIADSMSMGQKKIELMTFDHFKKVREMCTPEQQSKFDDIIQDALRMMGPRPPGRPH